jgi:hypothetical protein
MVDCWIVGLLGGGYAVCGDGDADGDGERCVNRRNATYLRD